MQVADQYALFFMIGISMNDNKKFSIREYR